MALGFGLSPDLEVGRKMVCWSSGELGVLLKLEFFFGVRVGTKPTVQLVRSFNA